jgi:hypothetical protein
MRKTIVLLVCSFAALTASLAVIGCDLAGAITNPNLTQLFPSNAPCQNVREIPNLIAPGLAWKCDGATVLPLSLATQLNPLPIPHLKLVSVAEVDWKTPSDSSRDLAMTIRIYGSNVSQEEFRSATEALTAQGNLVRADLNAPIKRAGSWGFEDNGGAIFGERNVLVAIDPGIDDCTSSCSPPSDVAMAHAVKEVFATLRVA